MRYHLLGPLEVCGESGPLDIGSPKQRTVLAALLTEPGRVVSTDRLVDAVWGEEPPPAATASLQAYVSNLRRALRDPDTAASPIVRRPPGYLIDVAGAELDVVRFRAEHAAAAQALAQSRWVDAARHADAALALWRGPVLVELGDAEWVRPFVRALEEERGACREALVTALLGSGETSRALIEAEKQYGEQPLREDACWLRLITLYRGGRAVEALDCYREHAATLADELGLEPSARLRDLHGAMLRQDAWLTTWPADGKGPDEAARPAAAGSVAPAAAAASSAAGTQAAGTGAAGEPRGEADTSVALVGRDRELAVVGPLVDAAAAGTPRWLVLSGPPGIGKSRLAEDVLRRFRATGGRECRARCPDEQGLPAWWAVRQLLRGLGVDAAQVLTPPVGTDADAARFLIYERLLDALDRAAAAGPLLLFVDDAHWADPYSLRFLAHLASTYDSGRLLVVLTVRSGEGSVELGRLVAAAARREGTRQLAVPPLTAAEVGRLVAQISGEDLDADEAALLAERTEGNPLFVSEYARLPRAERLGGGIPLAVRSVLGRRLEGLDTAVLQVVRTAAVIGDVLDIDLLAATTRLDRAELADLLDDAADERIIVTTDDGSYAFAHNLLREEVLAGLSASRRQRLHARVAEALGPHATGEQLTRRAAHLLAAVPLVDAADALVACRAAAEEAEAAWSSELAARWWDAALQAYDLVPAAQRAGLDRDDLLVARLAALARSGRGQTVLDVADAELLDAARHQRTSSVGRLAAALLRTAGAWPWSSYSDDPSPLLTRLAGIEPLLTDDPAAHARVLAAMATGSYYDSDPNVPDLLSRNAVAIAESLGDPDVLADALLGRALCLSGCPGRIDDVLAALDRLASLEHRLRQADDVQRHALLTLELLIRGDIDGVAEHQRLGAAGSDLLRLPVPRAQLRWIEGTVSEWRGDLERAEQLYHAAVELHRGTELYHLGVFELAMILLRWTQGRLAEAALPEDQDRRVVPWVVASLALVHGDDALATRIVAAELAKPPTEIWTTLGQLTLFAHVAIDRGLIELVRPVLARLEPHHARVANIGMVGTAGPVALVLARAHALLGDRGAARRQLAEAQALAERSGGLPSRLRCRLLELQLDRSDGAPAGQLAAEARDLAVQAERIGMVDVAGHARELAGDRA